MTDDGHNPSGGDWPLPKFRFQVEMGGEVMTFQEVSGLDTEAQPIEYRAGQSPTFSALKMPGLKKYSDVTLKRGVFKSDGKFWDWFNGIKMNTATRFPVTITLLDEAGSPTMAWTLANAWPTKISGTDLESTGTDVAVETLVLAHEGLTIAGG
jgi:phage tail-like protein